VEAALGKAQTVIAHASTLTDTVREYADVVSPPRRIPKGRDARAPDGRVQRLLMAIGRRAAGSATASDPRGSHRRCGGARRPRPRRAGRPDGVAQLFGAVPFYAGLTLDAIGGRGVRWPAGEAAGACPRAPGSLRR
jgi:NADH-quinone oxidoreductase subunit G